MGKYAQYLKRGTARQFGIMAPPANADWSITGTTVSTITATRTANFPSGANQWVTRAIRVSTGLVSGVSGSGVGTTNTTTGLSTGVQYAVQAAWTLNAVQVSEWSDKQLTTLP